MADIKISQLGAAIAVGDTDLVPIVSGGNTLKATAAQVKEHSIGNTNISSIGDGSVTGAISSINTDKQPKTLATSITVDGTEQTTVEGALGAINTDLGATKQALTNETKDMNNILGAKNLLKNNMASSQVDHAVTITVNSDGTVSTSGTASGGTVGVKINGEIPIALSPGRYILSGCPIGGSTTTYRLALYNGNNYIDSDIGDGLEFEVTNQTDLRVYLQITSGTSAPSSSWKPMIRPASIIDDTYVPYAKTNRELTIDNIITTEEINVSGYDGTTKESTITATLKSGYTGYVLKLLPSVYNTAHYVQFYGDLNNSTGNIVFIHNLASNVSSITVKILWKKN